MNGGWQTQVKLSVSNPPLIQTALTSQRSLKQGSGTVRGKLKFICMFQVPVHVITCTVKSISHCEWSPARATEVSTQQTLSHTECIRVTGYREAWVWNWELIIKVWNHIYNSKVQTYGYLNSWIHSLQWMEVDKCRWNCQWVILPWHKWHWHHRGHVSRDWELHEEKFICMIVSSPCTVIVLLLAQLNPSPTVNGAWHEQLKFPLNKLSLTQSALGSQGTERHGSGTESW